MTWDLKLQCALNSYSIMVIQDEVIANSPSDHYTIALYHRKYESLYKRVEDIVTHDHVCRMYRYRS